MLCPPFNYVHLVWLFAFFGCSDVLQAGTLKVSPSEVTLERPEATQQLVVYQSDATGRSLDITRKVSIQIDPPSIAIVDERGLISPMANGTGSIIIQRRFPQP